MTIVVFVKIFVVFVFDSLTRMTLISCTNGHKWLWIEIVLFVIIFVLLVFKTISLAFYIHWEKLLLLL